jgi:hypothetical protein
MNSLSPTLCLSASRAPDWWLMSRRAFGDGGLSLATLLRAPVRPMALSSIKGNSKCGAESLFPTLKPPPSLNLIMLKRRLNCPPMQFSSHPPCVRERERERERARPGRRPNHLQSIVLGTHTNGTTNAHVTGEVCVESRPCFGGWS